MVFLCTSSVFFLVLNGKCCIFKVNTSSCVATKFLEGVKLIIKVFIPVEKSKSIVFVECCKVFARVHSHTKKHRILTRVMTRGDVYERRDCQTQHKYISLVRKKHKTVPRQIVTFVLNRLPLGPVDLFTNTAR